MISCEASKAIFFPSTFSQPISQKHQEAAAICRSSNMPSEKLFGIFKSQRSRSVEKSKGPNTADTGASTDASSNGLKILHEGTNSVIE
jgi:hypothetical protein